ncbi:MAG TPA: protein kinase [Kofleriaceae bacterium]
MTGSKVGPWRVVAEQAGAYRPGTFIVAHAETKQVAVLEVYGVPAARFGSYVERLRRVMHAVNRIGHPAVPTIFDVGTLADGRPFVIGEQIDGVTLGKELAARRLPLADAIALLIEIGDALIVAHAAGVVHRALGVDNVVLVQQAQAAIKLIDWGIADDVRQQPKPGTAPVRSKTAADDVHAFGVLMHRVLGDVPAELEPLWIAMLADLPSARPTILEVTKQLRSIQRPPTPVARTERASPRLAAPVAVPPVVAPAATVAAEPADKPLVVKPVAVVAKRGAPRGAKSLKVWGTAAFVIGCAASLVSILLISSHSRDAQPPASRRNIAAQSQPPRSDRVARTTAPRTRSASAAPIVTPTAAAPKPSASPAPIKAVSNRATAPTRVAVKPQPQLAPKPQLAPRPQLAPSPTLASINAAPAAARTAVAQRAMRVRAHPAAMPVVATATDDRLQVMALHQRVGRRLLVLERGFGAATVADVASRYKWIRLDVAMTTPSLRKLVTRTLRDLLATLDQRLAAACSRAPDAAACRS